jgi:hypothetical protein
MVTPWIGGGKKHSDQDDCEAKSLGMLRVLFYAPPLAHQLEHAFELKAGWWVSWVDSAWDGGQPFLISQSYQRVSCNVHAMAPGVSLTVDDG